MKTLQLRNGDFVLGQGGYTTVTGTAKIRQDLALALGEPLGDDRFHPDWGSVLPNYVGQPITDETEMLVQAECARVIQQYIDAQRTGILNDVLNGNRTRYTTDDVVVQVTDIAANADLDNLRVKLSLLTQASQNVTITRTVSL